jgi:penicillin-binding protein activator
MNRHGAIALATVLVVVFAGCTTTRTVQRTAADAQTDLSGRWNDTDARLVAEEMVDDLLARPWLQSFMDDKGDRPVVIVGVVRNRTSEHIDTSLFINSIERELINSGAVRFVASAEQREALREERMDQQTQASRDTIARLGRETGANFMLQGQISSTVDQIEGQRAVFYQTDLELISIETSEKVWIGTKQIKKVIEQASARF